MPIKLYDVLPNVTIASGAKYQRPATRPDVAHYDDPALWVLTDFSKDVPYCIGPDAAIPVALTAMKTHRVHSLLVIDSKKHFIGLVTSEDILGEKPVKIIQEDRIPRNEINVNAVMIPFEDLLALDMALLKASKVGNVAHTLVESKQHYALAIDLSEAGDQTVCGIFSITDISDKLGYNVKDKIGGAQSVAELQHKLKSI